MGHEAAQKTPRPANARPAVEFSPAQQRIVLLLILGATLFSYLGALKFEFVYDDKIMQVTNPLIHEWRHVPEYFTHDLWSHRPEQSAHYYRPALLLWYMTVYSVAGLEPALWHFSTLLIHLLLVGMVWLLARRTLSDSWTAALATLLFALHPIHVETVTWIGGVNESWLAILWIGTYLCYRNFRERAEHKAGWLAASLFLFAWALLFKETAVALPLFIVLDEFIRGADGDEFWTRFKKGIAYAVMFVPFTVIYMVVRTWVLRSIVPPGRTPHGLLQMIYTAVSVFGFYMKHVLWPVQLSVVYDLPYVESFSAARVLVPLLLFAAGASLCRLCLDRKSVAGALNWLLVPMLPALAAAVLLGPASVVHDRYLCLPALGICLVAAMLIGKPGSGGAQARWMQGAVTAGLAALMIAGIVRESAPWANNRTLFTRGVEVSPNEESVNSWLSSELLQEGQPRAAAAVSQRYLAKNDRSWYAHYDLANAYFVLQDFPAAEKHYARATELYPENAREFFYLGLSRMRLGDPAGAGPVLRRAIELSPRGPGFHYALGQSLESQGRLEEAVAEYRRELENYPENPSLRRHLEELEAETASKARKGRP